MRSAAIILFGFMLTAPGSAAYPAGPCDLVKVTAPSSSENAYFGRDVSLCGNLLAVGARQYNRSPGSVWIYEHDGVNWVEQAELMASDGTGANYFGHDVALVGDRLLVGAHNDNSETGAVYVFHLESGVWVEEAKLTASDGQPHDAFGHGLAFNGTWAAIGAFLDSDGILDESGAVYVFSHEDGVWSERQKLTAADAEAEDWFGYSVALHENVIAVGAKGRNGTGRAGKAYAFRYLVLSDTWRQEQLLLPSIPEAQSKFGQSVAVSDDLMLVGASDQHFAGANSGVVFCFQFDGSSWQEIQYLAGQDTAAEDYFGIDVFLKDRCAVIGARGNSNLGVRTGSAYTYVFDGSLWAERCKLNAADGTAGDWFGIRVCLDSNFICAGAEKDGDLVANGGSAYVVDRNCCCQTVQTVLDCSPASGTLPFTTAIGVSLTNNFPDSARQIAGRIDLQAGGGQMIINWRTRYMDIPAGQTFFAQWNQTIPACDVLVGENVFTLHAMDVTPTPYNQPPYPPAGDTATAGCRVTGIAR